MKEKVIRTSDELWEFCEYILQNRDKVKYIALDIETEFFSDNVWSPIQMKTLYWIWLYVDEEHSAFIFNSPEIDLSHIDYLVHIWIPILLHNAKFDLQVLLNLWYITQIDEIIVYDTMILAHLENEKRESYGLKQLTKHFFWIEPTKLAEIWDKPTFTKKMKNGIIQGSLFEWTWEEERVILEWEEKLAKYCIDDCRNTFNLFNVLKKSVDEQDDELYQEKKSQGLKVWIWKLFEDLEMPFLKVLLDMEMKWVYVDKKYLSELKDKVSSKLIDLEIDIYRLAWKRFDIASPKQLQDILFKQTSIDMPIKYRTPKWDMSTDSAALQYIVKTYNSELCRKLLEWRELSKLLNSFIVWIPKLTIDSVVHTSFNQNWTESWRISSSSPNLQQLPRRADEFNIRKAFKPRPWFVFIDSDFSQLELRIAAFFSKDDTMREIYTQGWDIHQATADKVWCSRQQAKSVNFWILYGTSSYWLSDLIWVSVEQAQVFIDEYYKWFPKVKSFIDFQKKKISKMKFVETLLKRRRRFPDFGLRLLPKGVNDINELDEMGRKRVFKDMYIRNSSMERQGVNSTIQWTASDIMKVVMRNIYKEIKPYWAFQIIQVHDEIIVECPEEHKDKVVEIIKYQMENSVKLWDIPLLAEPKISNEWEK